MPQPNGILESNLPGITIGDVPNAGPPPGEIAFVVTGSDGSVGGPGGTPLTDRIPTGVSPYTFITQDYWPAATEAAIRAAITAAGVAGGGIVHLPQGSSAGAWAKIPLTSPLPAPKGVRLEGVVPVTVGTNLTPENFEDEFDFVSGTVFEGDGTFIGISGNATDQPTPPSDVETSGLEALSIHGVGFDNFTDGIRLGARNIMGIINGSLDQIFIRNCSGWGMFLGNPMFVDIGHIRTCLCQNGQFIGFPMPLTTMSPGNLTIHHLFHEFPRDGRDTRLCKGIVIDTDGQGGAVGSGNEIHAFRIQVNKFGTQLLSVTATFNGTTSAAIPDGTKFMAGQLVTFTASGSGLVAGQMYYVQSVSGNTITLGNSRHEAALTPTTGTLTLITYGFPSLAVLSPTTNSNLLNSRFAQLDIEGSVSAGVYAENTSNVTFELSDIATTAHAHFVGRRFAFGLLRSENGAITDFDGTSTSSRFDGARGLVLQRQLRGGTFDFAGTVYGLNVGPSVGSTHDIQSRAGSSLVPASGGMGEKIVPRDNAITLSSQGDYVCRAGSNVFTLPTIVTDTTNPNLSHVGWTIRIINVGTGTPTIATDGTQLINELAGVTTTPVPPLSELKLVASKDTAGNLFWRANLTLLLGNASVPVAPLGTEQRFVPASVGWFCNPLIPGMRALVPTLNRLFVHVFQAPVEGLTIDKLDCFTTIVGSAGAVTRAGVYQVSDQAHPVRFVAGAAFGTLLADAGTVATDSGTGQKVFTLSSPITITGDTWFAIAGVDQVATAATRNVGGQAGAMVHSPFGNSSTVGYNADPGLSMSVDSITGALPATFTPTNVQATDSGVGLHRSA